MARKKSNDLKFTEIKKVAKSLDQKETYQMSTPDFEGKDLHFYPVFKETILSELLDELQEKMIYAYENEINMDDKMMFHYAHFLAIKYFTHLGKDIPNEFERQLDSMDWLMNTRLYKEIIEEIFPSKELNKIWDAVSDFLARVQFTEKLSSDVAKKFDLLDLENKDLITQAFANKKVKFKEDKNGNDVSNVLADKVKNNDMVQ